MAYFTKISVFALVFVVGSLSNSSDGAAVQNGPGLRVTFLGSFEGTDYYGGGDTLDWFSAYHECANAGMKLVRLHSQPEIMYLLSSGILENHGPFWLGARDLGRAEMYRWVSDPNEIYNPPSPSADPIEDFVNFYHAIEEGPMALMFHASFGSSLVGVHSHKVAAKAFCQF